MKPHTSEFHYVGPELKLCPPDDEQKDSRNTKGWCWILLYFDRAHLELLIGLVMGQKGDTLDHKREGKGCACGDRGDNLHSSSWGCQKWFL